jgi:asparaginyl-tRNA synthetase
MLKVGEMFKVTVPFDGTPRTEDGKVNKEDFFGKETNLTVSGQLEGETFAMALGQIYTLDLHLEPKTRIHPTPHSG